MKDSVVRSDLLRLLIFMVVIVVTVVGLKIYDTKTDQIGSFATKIYTKLFNSQ